MENSKLCKKTSFASAERKSKAEIMSQIKELGTILKNNFVLDMIPDPALILNSNRQAVLANKALLDFLNIKDDTSVIGLRPGELLHCVHAKNDSGGCGTTRYCEFCGAVKSILRTQKNKNKCQGECKITTETGEAYNLRVWTFPFGKYSLFIMRNIADEVYREVLENIFFNDLTNIVSALHGWLNMIDGNSETFQQYETLLVKMTEEILEDINAQRDMLMAEEGSMEVNWEFICNNIDIINFVVEKLSEYQKNEGKKILISKGSKAVNFKTDTRLLKRIIVSIAKNAIEASEANGSVLLSTFTKGDKVVFEVYNKGFIQKDIQFQIFNRFFSTKEHGHGLGTYNVKLLLENYLQGKIYFTSTPEDGTSFFIECPIEPVIENNS